MVNFNNLHSFYVCAEHLNISKAATLLGISQPSLSMQIKNLEEQVGTTLFLRNGKSISLTSKGQELLKSSNMYFDLKKEIKKCLETKVDAVTHPTLRILVTDQVERPFVAEVVSKVARKSKGKMAIFSSTTEEALSKTENNETDILLSHEKVDTTWNYIKVDFPVFFVTGSVIPKLPTFDHAKNIQKVLDYFGEDLIIPAGSLKLGKEFSSFKRKNSLKQNVLLESDIISCLVRFVASGTGCSFLPLPYIKSSLYESHIHMIGPREGFWKHSIYIYANIPEKDLEGHPLVKTIRAYGTV